AAPEVVGCVTSGGRPVPSSVRRRRPVRWENAVMFRWLCFGLAAVFVCAALWMLDDMRRQVRRSAELLQENGRAVHGHLPVIVERTRKSADTVSQHMPAIVEKTKATTDTLAELAADVRQLKELAGVTSGARDQNLVAYANSVLKAIESSNGTIGLKKVL